MAWVSKKILDRVFLPITSIFTRVQKFGVSQHKTDWKVYVVFLRFKVHKSHGSDIAYVGKKCSKETILWFSF